MGRARKIAQEYQLQYNESIPVSQLVQKLATVVQEFTQSGWVDITYSFIKLHECYEFLILYCSVSATTSFILALIMYPFLFTTYMYLKGILPHYKYWIIVLMNPCMPLWCVRSGRGRRQQSQFFNVVCGKQDGLWYLKKSCVVIWLCITMMQCTAVKGRFESQRSCL